MFQCDRECDGKFGNFVGTKHTRSGNCCGGAWRADVMRFSWEMGMVAGSSRIWKTRAAVQKFSNPNITPAISPASHFTC